MHCGLSLEKNQAVYEIRVDSMLHSDAFVVTRKSGGEVFAGRVDAAG
jgi:hypothetical protein